MTARAKTLIVATACGAAVVTLLISVLPFVEFAYRSDAMHAAVESAATVIASLAAILVLGRFRRSAALPDLLLAGALALLAVSNFVFWTIPTLDSGPTTRFEIWAPLLARALSVCFLAAAAFAPPRRIARPSRATVLMPVGVAAGVAGVAILAALVAPHLDPGIDPSLSPNASDRPRIVGNAALLGLQLGLMLLYFSAAAGFARRAGRDELMLWFASAAVLAGFARLNYFLFPSIYTEWVYTGDALRFGSYLLLFIGAVRQIAAYQRDLAQMAVADERRRIARDLHDGVAQDLAYISREGRRLGAQGVESAALERLSDAADRALDLSRDAIAALTGRADEPLAIAVARAAEEVAGRAGATVRMQLAPDVKVPGPARDDLVRIVREAVTNATRHGGARRLTINLERSDGITLTVGDDGSGFELEGLNGRDGFGLTSMRERAEQLGGEFSVVSFPGGGTEVTVRLP
jgi:signal transduction histidine kinase